MRVLSVKQPWATLIIHHRKNVENRGWSTRYRGLVAIHASLRPDRDAHPQLWELVGGETAVPYGAVIGVVRLVDVVRDAASVWAEPGAVHWVLTDPRPVAEPIPWRGGLGLREAPAELVAALAGREAAA